MYVYTYIIYAVVLIIYILYIKLYNIYIFYSCELPIFLLSGLILWVWRQSICNCLMVEGHSCKKCDVPRKQGFQRQIYGSVRFTKVIFQRRIGRTNRCSKKNVKRSQLKKKAALYEVWGVWNGTFYALAKCSIPKKGLHTMYNATFAIEVKRAVFPKGIPSYSIACSITLKRLHHPWRGM